MISKVFGQVGVPVRFEGSAYDFGCSIAAMQFSMDGGKTWTTYDTPGTNDYQNLFWTFDYIPTEPGFYVLMVRSVNSVGEASPESAYAELLIE